MGSLGQGNTTDVTGKAVSPEHLLLACVLAQLHNLMPAIVI
jgi:hypothetical protein